MSRRFRPTLLRALRQFAGPDRRRRRVLELQRRSTLRCPCKGIFPSLTARHASDSSANDPRHRCGMDCCAAQRRDLRPAARRLLALHRARLVRQSFSGNSAAAGAPPTRRPWHARAAGCSNLRRAVRGWFRAGDAGNAIARWSAVPRGVPASGSVVVAHAFATGAVESQQVQEILARRIGAGSNPEPADRVHRHSRRAGPGVQGAESRASGADHHQEPIGAEAVRGCPGCACLRVGGRRVPCGTHRGPRR